MTDHELPSLQPDMFSGKLMDNRTRTQKNSDKRRSHAQQLTLFKAREMVEFGVNPHPQFSLPPHATLRLMNYDPRTPEQIETDTQKQAEDLTHPLFAQPLLKLVGMTPDHYRRHLETVPQLPPMPEYKLLAPPDLKPLSMALLHPIEAQPMPFEQWLQTDLGQEIYDRITRNRHNASLYMANWQSLEDVQQEALLYLMQTYKKHGFSQILAAAKDDDHAAAIITKMCLVRSANKYARRKDFEQALPDEDAEPFEWGSPRPTDNPRRTNHWDMRLDLYQATTRTIAHLMTQPDFRPRNPIQHTTKTILFAEAHFGNGRYGERDAYCEENGVSRKLIFKWKPRIFERLREELVGYGEKRA